MSQLAITWPQNNVDIRIRITTIGYTLNNLRFVHQQYYCGPHVNMLENFLVPYNVGVDCE